MCVSSLNHGTDGPRGVGSSEDGPLQKPKDCEEIQKLLLDYAAGKVSADINDKINHHLYTDRCRCCVEAITALIFPE